MPSQIAFQLNLICVTYSSHFFLFGGAFPLPFLMFGSPKVGSDIKQLTNNITGLKQEIKNLHAQLQMTIAKQTEAEGI